MDQYLSQLHSYNLQHQEAPTEYLVLFWGIRILILAVIAFFIVRMWRIRPAIFSHWHHLMETLQASPQDVYTLISTSLKERNLPETVLEDREYLRVKRRDLTFDICAAPFARGFFFSWWLGGNLGFFSRLIFSLPFIGPPLMRVFRPETYYRIDTALMFQDSVHSAVMEVIDGITTQKGLRSLSDSERKPVLNTLFAK
jgi:hypothetical protein